MAAVLWLKSRNRGAMGVALVLATPLLLASMPPGGTSRMETINVSNAEARADIFGGRARLQETIRAEVRLFAYPSGKPGQDFEARHAAMLRSQGFQAAVTTAWAPRAPAPTRSTCRASRRGTAAVAASCCAWRTTCSPGRPDRLPESLAAGLRFAGALADQRRVQCA